MRHTHGHSRKAQPIYPPQIDRPDYSSCGIGYYKADKCPNCGMKTRKESRKRGDNGEKPWINLDFEDRL